MTLGVGPEGKPANIIGASIFAAQKLAVDKPASPGPRETLSRISCGECRARLLGFELTELDELGKARRRFAKPGRCVP